MVDYTRNARDAHYKDQDRECPDAYVMTIAVSCCSRKATVSAEGGKLTLVFIPSDLLAMSKLGVGLQRGHVDIQPLLTCADRRSRHPRGVLRPNHKNKGED